VATLTTNYIFHLNISIYSGTPMCSYMCENLSFNAYQISFSFIKNKYFDLLNVENIC
jgi:coproporphyrinogen III oxidase-like Fe-S oxidoreductase